MEWGNSGRVDPRPCFFMGLELLDNLPHDKVAWIHPTCGLGAMAASSREDTAVVGDQQLCETLVTSTSSGEYAEVFRPVQDRTISDLLDICPDIVEAVQTKVELPAETGMRASFNRFMARFNPPPYRAAFIPTGLLLLLRALRKRIPQHRAILADFDHLPRSKAHRSGDLCPTSSLWAHHAPLVSSRDPSTGAVKDHGTYLVPFGSADIFFPTRFSRLLRLHAAICTGGNRGLAMKQASFLKLHADINATRTTSGYNPLLQDYLNASVFLSAAAVVKG